ncbi:MAG: undecaprenyl-diphosphate phosphatase [Clostridiales bacterium]|nr:undecaprenyl-diphosphate phosphatase [Clostridiales bacterium]
MLLVSVVYELIKAVVLGIVEGITEWLPISSTGHLLLADEFVKLQATDEFYSVFLYVIQLGAILAVVVLFWNKLIPFGTGKSAVDKRHTYNLWCKIIIACIPGAVFGILFNDRVDALIAGTPAAKAVTIAAALIFYGIIFIVIENAYKNKPLRIDSVQKLDYKTALVIGLFQVLSLIPGTSRSGITIIGAMLIGTSRMVAAEFTFFLSIPVMFGQSLLKLYNFGIHFTGPEAAVLITGTLVAFVVSLIAIRFLMNYVKKHDFKVFGWYRIALGVIVLGYFLIFA